MPDNSGLGLEGAIVDVVTGQGGEQRSEREAAAKEADPSALRQEIDRGAARASHPHLCRLRLHLL